MTMTVDTPQAPATSSEPLTPSAGTLLRGYRENLGIKAEALAAKLHVPLNKLQALEQDRLDALPDAMFARALALAVCRQLQADATPVLARLPAPDASPLANHNERGLDFPLKRPSLLPSTGLDVLRELSRGQWLGILAVVLVTMWIASPWGDRDTSIPGTDILNTQQVVVPLTTAPVAAPPIANTMSSVPAPEATAPATTPIVTTSTPTVVPPVNTPSGKMVVTPLQTRAVVLTPVTPAPPEGAEK